MGRCKALVRPSRPRLGSACAPCGHANFLVRQTHHCRCFWDSCWGSQVLCQQESQIVIDFINKSLLTFAIEHINRYWFRKSTATISGCLHEDPYIPHQITGRELVIHGRASFPFGFAEFPESQSREPPVLSCPALVASVDSARKAGWQAGCTAGWMAGTLEGFMAGWL